MAICQLNINYKLNMPKNNKSAKQNTGEGEPVLYSYLVKGNLDHNLVSYKPGDIVELTLNEASQLAGEIELLDGQIVDGTDEKKSDNDKNTDELIPHILTQEDLDANPDLVEQGLKVGDEIGIPANEPKE